MKKFQELLDDSSVSDNYQSSLRFLDLDLSDMKSCIYAANRFKELETRLDIVIANAALSVMVSSRLDRDVLLYYRQPRSLRFYSPKL